MLALLFGRSVLAVGIVIAAFMAGLALGSYLLGKFSDKSRNPLRLYGLYEIGIGVTALVASTLIANISPLYVQIHQAIGSFPLVLAVVRFVLAFLLLIVPTLLMGATLPVLARVMVRRLKNVGRELGELYAFNTLGAVAGAMAAGFLLIRFAGLQGSVYLAVGGNLGVGLLALALSQGDRNTVEFTEGRPPDSAAQSAETASSPCRSIFTLLLVAFACSGITSFAYEIFWTRALGFILGNSTYAFTLVLTAFLAGIALGGYLMRFIAGRFSSPIKLFAVIEVLIGVSSAASLPVLFTILTSEAVSTFLRATSSQFGSLIVSESIVALLLMLIPATLIGTTLPLVGRIVVADLSCTGTMIGRVYAANTVGNVVGALMPGLLILPLLGIQRGVLLMAALNVSLGIVLLGAQGKNRPTGAVVFSIAVFLLLGVAIVRFPLDFQFPSESQTKNDAVLFYNEGGGVTTKVWTEANQGKKFISVDGINIGGTGATDYKQQILAHLPKLFLKSYSSELSIGLGSGILLGESGRHAQIQTMVCVEISSGVVNGAKFFWKENYGVLDDPRSKIVVDDIGHYLQTSSEKFDIISADGKTAEKFSSNSFAYSTEYYELIRQHLAENGMAIQWIPTALPKVQYDMVLRTFVDAFPHASLWYFPPVGEFFIPNSFLIGSNEGLVVDSNYLTQSLTSGTDSFYGIKKYGIKSAEDVIMHFVASEDTLRQSIPPGPLNSFNRPYYEFYLPADYGRTWQQRALDNHQFLMSIREKDFAKEVLDKRGLAERDRWRDAYSAEGLFLKGYAAQLNKKPYPEVITMLDQSIERAPFSEVLRNEVVAYLLEQFRFNYLRGDYPAALNMGLQATEYNPQSVAAHENYGMALLLTKQTGAAESSWLRVRDMDPGRVLPLRGLGVLALAKGDVDRAMLYWQEALLADPNDIMTLVALGAQAAKQGALQRGEEYLQKAYMLAPKNPAVINGYAQVTFLAGDIRRSRKIVLAGGGYYEGNPAFERIRAKILEEIP